MTTKAKILKIIRENCINCVVGQITLIDNYGGEKPASFIRLGLAKTQSRAELETPKIYENMPYRR